MKKYLFILSSMIFIIACEKKSPINDDKDKLPEYLDIEVSISQGKLHKENPACQDEAADFNYIMKTYIALESWFGKNENDFLDSVHIASLPKTFKHKVKREEDRVFDMAMYWEPGCRHMYYYDYIVKIQGIKVKESSALIGSLGYHSRLPYHKNDFEKLKNGKWTDIYH